MSLPKYIDLNNLTTLTDIDQEIFLIQKKLKIEIESKKRSINYAKPCFLALPVPVCA